ncbi:hypothetical protein MY8738_010028 [Beauveria namnaoensis]
MQILSLILFTSLATAAPATDKRACASSDYECIAATYGPIKPGDAASQPEKLDHQEADFDNNRNWGLVFDEEEDLEEEGDGSRPISFDPIKKRACALTDYECMAATYGPIKPGDAASQPDKPIHKEADFDTNRNWGLVFDEEEDLEEEGDGSRPISFDPIKPKVPSARPAAPVEDEDEEGDGSRPISFEPIKPSRPNSRPPPPVEHGSEQAGSA